MGGISPVLLLDARTPENRLKQDHKQTLMIAFLWEEHLQKQWDT